MVGLSAIIYLFVSKILGMLNLKVIKLMNKAFKEVVFSVSPNSTGNLHLGNYLGAINFVELQKKKECIYCVVDLHAITVFQDPIELKNILETTAGFLACGLDFKKSIIFNQSPVSGHAELAWILNCVSREADE